MRTTTDQATGITVNYPDEVSFAFNPFLVEAIGCDALSVMVSLNGQIRYIINTQPFSRRAYVDAQEYLQSLFDGMPFGVDYSQQMADSEQGLQVNISVTATSGEDDFGFGFTTYVVWGGVKPDGRDNFRAMRHIKRFKNFPFAFGLYAEEDTSILFGHEQAPQSAQTIGASSIYNFGEGNLDDARYHIIYEYDGVIQQATFDNTFDLTFYLAQNVDQRPILRIDVDETTDEGIYLRWIDRHGYIAHWLFKPGDEQRQIAAIREFSRNALTNYSHEYGFQRGSGRRQSMSRNDVCPCCAPFVTKEQFDYLQDLTSSPMVEMYAGRDANDVPQWVGVAVQPATYTKNREELQDFIFNLILPETPIQSL